MKKPSLLKEFTLFVSIVITSILVLTSFYAWRTYNEQYERIAVELENAAMRSERSLHQSFQYSNYILDYILSQINGKWDDLNYIDNILHTLKVNQDINTVLSWNMFSWSNEYHKITVNSLRRILSKPLDVSGMSNMAKTMTEPGVMHLGNPTYGSVSGELVIPASIGAVDERGHYVGAIGIGFNVEGIASKMDHLIDNGNINYAIIDKNYAPIVRSPHEKISILPSTPQFLKAAQPEIPSGMLSSYSPFKENSNYIYYQKVQDTPYTVLISYNTDVARTEIWRQISIELIKFMVAGSIIILLLTLLYRRLIDPVTQLSIAADKISQGDHEVNIPVSGHYEITNLAEKLKQIVSYINEIERVRNEIHTQSIALSIAKDEAERAHYEVQMINNTLEERVAERTKFLQEVLASKQEFINHLGHEVRTPVSSIQMRTAILLDMWEDFTQEEVKESVKDIGANAFRLCALLTNLLDLFKSNAGKMTYNMQEHDIALIAGQVANECLPLYQQKSLALIIKNIAETSTTSCDAMRISQVIRNLLSNACRYTPKGSVLLTIFNSPMSCEDGRMIPSITLSLKDEGVGIPEGEQHKIFEAFAQSSRTNTKAGGTGLGLAICLEIISAHHGQIWVENNKDSKGCTFFCAIPLTENIARN